MFHWLAHWLGLLNAAGPIYLLVAWFGVYLVYDETKIHPRRENQSNASKGYGSDERSMGKETPGNRETTRLFWRTSTGQKDKRTSKISVMRYLRESSPALGTHTRYFLRQPRKLSSYVSTLSLGVRWNRQEIQRFFNTRTMRSQSLKSLGNQAFEERSVLCF